MRIALGAALLAMAVLPGCQERPQTFHVVPAYQRGLLALTELGPVAPEALHDTGRSIRTVSGQG